MNKQMLLHVQDQKNSMAPGVIKARNVPFEVNQPLHDKKIYKRDRYE